MSPASYLAAPPRVAGRNCSTGFPHGYDPRRVELGDLRGADRRFSGRFLGRRDCPRAGTPRVAGAEAAAPRDRSRAQPPRGSRRGYGRHARRRDRQREARGEPLAPAGRPGPLRDPAPRDRRSGRAVPTRGLGHPAPVRVAVVDLGTNTTRLLVADVADGRLEEVHRETRITRLGEGVDERRRLLPVPIARVRNVLAEYRRTLESLGSERTLLVATSAVRDAENGEAFLGEIEWSYGFATRLLSGDEEAQLTRRGVEPAPGTLVLDIGGGSTELIVDDFNASLDLGSVRYTERFVHTDPPNPAELDAC